MKKVMDLNHWGQLAIGTCPSCQNQNLLLENQFHLSAIFACQKCFSRYWIAAIRQQGTYQLPSLRVEVENFSPN